jgi:hypothetical protein
MTWPLWFVEPGSIHEAALCASLPIGVLSSVVALPAARASLAAEGMALRKSKYAILSD